MTTSAMKASRFGCGVTSTLATHFVARMQSGIGVGAKAHPGLHPGYEEAFAQPFGFRNAASRYRLVRFCGAPERSRRASAASRCMPAALRGPMVGHDRRTVLNDHRVGPFDRLRMHGPSLCPTF